MTNPFQESRFDVIILGAGPAGLTAAIYASRAGLSTLVIDESSAGGKVKTTHMVANYPGFPDPIEGYKLAENMKQQAARYGTKFELASEILDLSLQGEDKWVFLDSGTRYHSHYVILAMGSSPRLLNIPGEIELKGQGISYCATCDGEFYKGKDVVVIGGGNSAVEESLLLVKYVKSLTMVHQFDKLQAEKVNAEKLLADPKVTVVWSTEPREFVVDGAQIHVTVENLQTHERYAITKDGVFIFVGMLPNSGLLQRYSGTLQLTPQGYLETNSKMETGMQNVYAAGDLRAHSYYQITTATSDGTVAALEIIRKF